MGETEKKVTSADHGVPAKGRTRGKRIKYKLSKEEKKLETLERECRLLQADRAEYDVFLDRMDDWLRTRHQRVIQLFRSYDSSRSGRLTYQDFKLGMRDLSIPCLKTQLHLLAKLLDRDNSGTINYMELGSGLHEVRIEEEESTYRAENGEETGERSAENVKDSQPWLGKCVQTSSPSYVFLELRFLTFNQLNSHPGHFREVTNCDLTVYGLTERVRAHSAIPATKLSIFREPDTSQKSALPEHWSLEDSGILGGSRHSPAPAVLYYDYSVEFRDCPILNCDHNFTGKKQRGGFPELG
eukprot:gi/632987668/ref/XP_007882683.1/ PREDICTED: uncharacterized protein LOC103171703 [Callorhinchus milii]